MILEKKIVAEHKMCVLIFSAISSETLLILRWNERDMILKNVYLSSVKYTLFVSDFNDTWFFSTYFQKKPLKYQISWKSIQW